MASRGFEDYLEAIYILGGKSVKTGEVAKFLDINPASVSEMFSKLSSEGFVTYEKYRGVTLTKNGTQIGRQMCARHETLSEFLNIIGVPGEKAEKEACLIEHSVSKETMEKLTAFVHFVDSSPEGVPKWLAKFMKYLETGKMPGCKNPKKG